MKRHPMTVTRKNLQLSYRLTTTTTTTKKKEPTPMIRTFLTRAPHLRRGVTAAATPQHAHAPGWRVDGLFRSSVATTNVLVTTTAAATSIHSVRHCSSSGRTTASKSDSATSSSSSSSRVVDVENFTLNEEIVKQHQEIQAEWVKLSDSISQQQSKGDYAKILSTVDEGFALFDSVGPDDSPVHCQPMLWMTKAQAHFNRKEWNDAFDNATKAKQYFLKQGSNSVSSSSSSSIMSSASDEGRVREIMEFIAFVELERGHYAQAVALFDELLAWVAEGSRKALPMVQVIAVNMKRTLQTGKGRALFMLATKNTSSSNDETNNDADAVDDGAKKKTTTTSADCDSTMMSGVDRRELLDQALDLVIDSLSTHVDSDDVASARMALDTATLCYCAIGDVDKAEDACDKLESWCLRHNDALGLELAKSRRSEIEALKK